MSLRTKLSVVCVLLAAFAVTSFGAGPAAAQPLIARDGKIHACYKFKGKRKGLLRVVHGRRVRCPKRWKKVSWYAGRRRGPAGPVGPQGPPGPVGERGPAGVTAAVSVEGLENQVSELLARVQKLETVVGSLCAQTEALNEQTTALGKSLNSLGTLLEVALVAFEAPAVPAALPEYSCP